MTVGALPHSFPLRPHKLYHTLPAATRVRLADENALSRYDGLPVEAGGAATEHERSDVVLARWHGNGARKRLRGATVSSGADSSGECGGGLEKTSRRAPPASGGGATGRWQWRRLERRRQWHGWEEER
jgi:hypothetical protein